MQIKIYRYYFIAFLIILLNTNLLYAEPIIEISNIEIVENYYSKKVIKALVKYNGSIGDNVAFAALARTKHNTIGERYIPYAITTGEREVTFSVTK